MEREKKIVQISFVGIVVNLILVAMKAGVGMITGSIAVIMDAVNNLSDALSSVITIVGTKLAGRDPDKKHPYGYGQIEYISSITIAVIILMAGLTSFRESVEKIFHPGDTRYTVFSMTIIAVTVLVKLFLGKYVKGEGEKYHSESLVASGTDALFDAVISLSTLLAAIVSFVWEIGIEGYLGAVIAVVILKAGTEILLDSLSSIIGARVDSELSVKLKEYISRYPEILGAYDLTLHRYGPERIIGSVHVELPDELTARDIHRLTRAVTEDVYVNFGIILTVGIYAANTGEEIFANIKSLLKEQVARYPDILQMHGFYVDPDRMQISFDLVMDFKSEQKVQIRDAIIDAMQKSYPEYQFIGVLDSDVSD